MDNARGRIIIGIDPDVDRSGVARLDIGGAVAGVSGLTLQTLGFGDLLFFLLRTRDEAAKGGLGCFVVVEAGWMNRGNWHLRWHDTNKLACAKGYNVGRNHEAGRKIVETAAALGFSVVEQRPLRKLWRGKDGKITAAELGYFTGYKGRSNQDARDAALLAWAYAGLPVMVAPRG